MLRPLRLSVIVVMVVVLGGSFRKQHFHSVPERIDHGRQVFPGSLLAAGITIVFGIQVFVNIGVCTGILPTTGQALPFISAGGSSMMIFLAAMGILLSISRATNQPV